MKLAVVTPIPTPYRDPFWAAVSRRADIDLQVYYCSLEKSDRPWNGNWSQAFAAEVLKGCNLSGWRGCGASCYWNPDVARRLRDGKFDAIVLGGYNHPTMWSAIRHARTRGIPLFLMCESHSWRRRNSLRRRLKQIPVQWLVSRCAGTFPTGSLAEQYLLQYGAAPKSLTRIPNVPDVIQLQQTTSALRTSRAELRRRHAVDDRPTVLFAGRLISKKRAGLLIESFYKVRQKHDAQLIIVGDGPERAAHQRRVEQLDLSQDVHFTGFVQPHEMPAWYAMADLFVLPSSETWGVVVLEALAAGLPVIITNEVGCHPDVVVDRSLGDVIPAGDENVLTAALQDRLARPTNPETIHTAWAAVRESLRYEVLARQFIDRLQKQRSQPITGARAA
ncbi:MAG: glycosyltransferase [Planctomycetota bacterium]|nr:glycosyltransferase [Planctomycetota bacterium]